MLEKVKTALRIKSEVLDDEIRDIIAACLLDLGLAGINHPEADPLILRAVILFAKLSNGTNEDAERYQRAYDSLKCQLSLAGEYRAVE